MPEDLRERYRTEADGETTEDTEELPGKRPPRRRQSAETGGSMPDTERASRRERRLRGGRVSWRAAGIGAAVVLCVAAVLVVGSYTFLPPLAGTLFGQGLQDQLGLSEAPEVSVRSEPPPTMLAGAFEEGRVELGEVDFGEVRPERVTIDLDPFDLDVLGSVRSGSLRSEAPLSGTMVLEISEQEISRVAGQDAEVPIQGVELRPDRVIVSSGAELLGVAVPLSVVGRLRAHEEGLAFGPERVRAFGVPVPEEISDQLLSEADFVYPLEDLPYGNEVTGVEVTDGTLVLTLDLERIPVGSPDEEPGG